MRRTSIFLKSWVLLTFLTVTIMTLMYIGHAIISRAVFVGLREAVREMKLLMREAQSFSQ